MTTLIVPRTASRGRLPSLVEETGRVPRRTSVGTGASGSSPGSLSPSQQLPLPSLIPPLPSAPQDISDTSSTALPNQQSNTGLIHLNSVSGSGSTSGPSSTMGSPHTQAQAQTHPHTHPQNILTGATLGEGLTFPATQVSPTSALANTMGTGVGLSVSRRGSAISMHSYHPAANLASSGTNSHAHAYNQPHRKSVISVASYSTHPPNSLGFSFQPGPASTVPSTSGILGPGHLIGLSANPIVFAATPFPRAFIDFIRKLGRTFASGTAHDTVSRSPSRNGSAALSTQQPSAYNGTNHLAHASQGVGTEKIPANSPVLQMSIGSSVTAILAIICALGAHIVFLSVATKVQSSSDHDAKFTMLLPGLCAAALLLFIIDLYRTSVVIPFVRRVSLSLYALAFFGMWLLDPVWVVWMIPAVLFPALFGPQATIGFGAICPFLIGLAYFLNFVELRPWHHPHTHTIPFLLFSVLSFLVLFEFLLRLVFFQFEIAREEYERIIISLKSQNRSLKSEIKELRNIQMEEVLGTPAEKAINILRSIISDPKASISESQKSDVHLIIRLIGSNKIYATNASYGNIKPAEGVDDETHKWVLDQLVQQNIDEPKQETETEEVQLPGVPDEESTEAADKLVAQVNRLTVETNFRMKRMSIVDPRANQSKYLALYKMTDRLSDILENVDNWNFDILEFNQLVDGHALYVLGCYLLNRYEFPVEYGITDDVLRQFMAAIEEGYIDTPYHNALHAADVLQSFNSLICRGGLLRVLEPAEIFSCLFASIIHDFKHPGVNNNFLISVEDPLAISFNDISVLENYHVSEAFRLMTDEKYGILKNVPKDIKKKIRKTSIELVLATDMSKHADIMGALKNSISVGELTGSTFDSRLLMMKMAVKLSDVSNPAKLPHIAQEWTRRITDEFYNQGDKEKERTLPISPFMDRTQPVLSKSQIGFISFVVQPLAELWHSALNTGDECLHNLNVNLEYWKSRAEMEQNGAQQAQSSQPQSNPNPNPNPNPPPPPSPMLGKRPIPSINTSDTTPPSPNQTLKPTASMEIRPVSPGGGDAKPKVIPN